MSGSPPRDAGEFLACARSNRINAALLGRLPTLGLPQCHLVAGCLFQAVWNAVADKPAAWGVRDYDVFYFDDGDLSWEAEDSVIRSVDAMTRDLGAKFEVRNQARVHLWHEARFGVPYPRLASARDGVDRYLVLCTRVGVDVATGALYAPDGLGALCAGELRANPMNANPRRYLEKARSYRERWPMLRIMDEAEVTAAAQGACA